MRTEIHDAAGVPLMVRAGDGNVIGAEVGAIASLTVSRSDRILSIWSPTTEQLRELRDMCNAILGETDVPIIAAAKTERLKSAIRRQTVEAPNNRPNGPTEAALEGLQKSLSREAYAAFGAQTIGIANGWGAKLASSMADDTKELRESADAYFGEDFTKP